MLRRGVFWSPEITDADARKLPSISTFRPARNEPPFSSRGFHTIARMGRRMLDTLLIAGRESTRSFSLGVVLDLENPAHAAQEINHTGSGCSG